MAIMENIKEKSEIGMIGLGVMGRNLLYNLADHGFQVAGYDNDTSKVDVLNEEFRQDRIQSAANIRDFIGLLRQPRAVIMLVPAGAPVDSVINDLLNYLQPGDLIIDAGNSYFKDTDLRIGMLAEHGIQFMGVGISGGEEGARQGASIMPGGNKESWERVRSLFEAAAAKVNNIPCTTYLGQGSAGHFAKMVHNGIEYAIMQLISESYDFMKRGLNISDDKLAGVFSNWNKGELNSYLIEITGNIFSKIDEKSGKRLIDEILDVARQKGTGMWTSQSAMELQVPIPTIDVSVSMRDLSVFENQRETASKILLRPVQQFKDDQKVLIKQLHDALHSAMILTYAQGFALLTAASSKYAYNFDLESLAGIWRGGCIIRATLLNDIKEAFCIRPDLPNLLLNHTLSTKVMENQEHLRQIICHAADSGIPVPAFMSSLSYFDAFRSSWLPANLIQAQRDYFGAHTYERVDVKGTFHTEWIKNKIN
jgi:6-phosphogluconate dehydrogenase